MKTWQIAVVFSVSLVMLLGMQSSAFANSGESSESCPFKGDKADYDKTRADYSEHQSDKITKTSLDEKQVPSWVKANAKWWSTGQLNDSEFATGIKFLIDNQIIIISNSDVDEASEMQAPTWVKTTAGWWSDGLVSDAEFVSGLQHLVNHGII